MKRGSLPSQRRVAPRIRPRSPQPAEKRLTRHPLRHPTAGRNHLLRRPPPHPQRPRALHPFTPKNSVSEHQGGPQQPRHEEEDHRGSPPPPPAPARGLLRRDVGINKRGVRAGDAAVGQLVVIGGHILFECCSCVDFMATPRNAQIFIRGELQAPCAGRRPVEVALGLAQAKAQDPSRGGTWPGPGQSPGSVYTNIVQPIKV
ncbi:galactose oxidase/kelch repeat superfamily protein [Striga asiatica]|uniref:Galactose oxidase/kelch repeat superfamily protein n=1 Tax=Striga asiatica TaxID=4170 RepID=A0A5A7PP39_STRAF|nr:galactose oxidase/kelch repeat superfamily protein [Striga asiatica]